MSLSKTIHADGTATITIVLDGIAHSIPVGEWSRLLANAPVIEEAEC
jgi:hypothetical protein